MSEASAIVLVADGLRPDAFEEAIRTGDVPELASLRDTSGLNVVTTVFPSVTGVAYIPILTGMHPADAGVPGLRWFDRARRLPAILGHSRSYVGTQIRTMNADLAPAARTLYDAVDGRALGMDSVVTRGLPARNRLDRLDRQWATRLEPVLSHAAIDLVATRRSPSVVDLRRGTARACPIGLWTGIRWISTRSRSCATRRSMSATAYPDGVAQLARLVRADRSGDLVLSGAPGWDLRH